MMDTLVDMVYFIVHENQNDRYDRIYTKTLKLIWSIIHNNSFDLRVPAFNNLIDSTIKIRFTARTQITKNLCKILLNSLYSLLSDRLSLQFTYFESKNPTSHFFSNPMHTLITTQCNDVLNSLIDKTVLKIENEEADNENKINYIVDISKEKMNELPLESSDRPNFISIKNSENLPKNEKNLSAGIFGWCQMCRESANYYCKEKRSSICSVECKLKLVDQEEAYKKYLGQAQQLESVEKAFHEDYPSIFENLTKKCFDKEFDKEKLLFLELLYSVLKRPMKNLKRDPRFILFVKNNIFPNLMKIALNNEEEVLVYSLRIFVCLIENFKVYLRKEIGIFIEEVCLKMLESPNSKFIYKIYLLQVLTFMIENDLLAFELFLNFDCREDSSNLCQQIIDLLVKTCQGRFSKNIYKDMISSVDERVLKKEASKAIVKLIRKCSIFLRNAKNRTISEAPEDIRNVLSKKKQIEDAINKFNAGKKIGLKKLRELEFIDDSAESLANFLTNDVRVAQSQIGEVFGGEDEFSLKVLDCFLENIDFTGLDILQSLKLFLSKFELPGEGQKIERILDAFSKRVATQNSDVYSLDASFQLSFLLMMIHTDTYNPSVIDKMTLSSFLSIGKGILNHGKPVPPELLTKYFYNIKSEPLALHESERRKKEIQDTLSRSYKEKEKIFKNESIGFIDKFWNKVKMDEIIEDYRHVKSYSVLRIFLSNNWTSLLAFFSTSIATTEEIEDLRDLVDSTMSMIKLCDVFEMQTERNSFLSILVQFSNLEKTFSQNFTDKNLLFIQSILDIATKEGNHLRSGWKIVLDSIISINSYHQISESASKLPFDQLSIQQQNSLFIKRNFTRDCLKKLFADSSKLSEESLIFFLEGLSKLAVKELERIEETRFAYTIEQIMNVFHCNQYRNPLAWLRIWKVINQLFDDIVSQTNDKNISLVLLSSNCLKNLVSFSFSNENLIKNGYQSNILELYVTIMSNPNLRPDYLNFSLLTLMDLLRKFGDKLEKGCKELIAILNLAEEHVYNYINLPNENPSFEKINTSNPHSEALAPYRKEYINITGTLYLEVLQDILNILDFIFNNFDPLLPFLKDHISGLLNVIINLSRKANLEVVFKALQYQEMIFNMFWIEDKDNQESEDKVNQITNGDDNKDGEIVEKEDLKDNKVEEEEKNNVEIEQIQEVKEEGLLKEVKMDQDDKQEEVTDIEEILNDESKEDQVKESSENNQLDETNDQLQVEETKKEAKELNKINRGAILESLKKNPQNIYFINENVYYQHFLHPSLKSLMIYKKWNSHDDFKNAINRLFEFIHKINIYLKKDSWEKLFEDIFKGLLIQTVSELKPNIKNEYLEDFREIVLFCLKSMYNFALFNSSYSLELVEINYSTVLEIFKEFKNSKYFLEIVIISLTQNILETAKLTDNIWIDDIWAVLIKFLSDLFTHHIPTELVENDLIVFVSDQIEKTESEESLENASYSSLPSSVKNKIDFEDDSLPNLNIDFKYAEIQCRFVLNLMKLIEKIFKHTHLVAKSSEALIELAEKSKNLALKFNDNVLYRYIFRKKGYMYSKDCLPSLHSFEISVLRAKFFYLKKLYGAENADLIEFIIYTLKEFGKRCLNLKNSVKAFKSKPTKIFIKGENNQDFELYCLIDTQTRTLFMFDFVNEFISNFINKNDIKYFKTEEQNQELIDSLIDYLSTGPSLFHSNYLKCVECLGCNKCYIKTTKQRRFIDINHTLKKLIKQMISLEFEVMQNDIDHLEATPTRLEN